MAKFAFGASSQDNAVVAAVRGLTGKPLAAIKQHLADGSPFWESDSYFEDPQGVRNRTSGLVESLRKLGVEPAIYKLDESEDFDEVDADEARITPEVMFELFNSYDETKRGMQRQIDDSHKG